MFQPRFLTISGMILVAAISRLIPHPWNMTPVVAMALFGGAQFSNKKMAILVPLAAVFISDLFLGFYRHMIPIYLTYVIIVFIGHSIRNEKKFGTVMSASVISSITFFLITNFAVWTYGMYGYTFDGLMKCYTVAIPFFRNALIGDLFYSGILFGGFYLAEKNIPTLREQVV